jgi:hypothetical protein
MEEMGNKARRMACSADAFGVSIRSRKRLLGQCGFLGFLADSAIFSEEPIGISEKSFDFLGGARSSRLFVCRIP